MSKCASSAGKVFRQFTKPSKKIPSKERSLPKLRHEGNKNSSLIDQYKAFQNNPYFTEELFDSLGNKKFTRMKKKPSSAFHYLCFDDFDRITEHGHLKSRFATKGFKSAVLKNAISLPDDVLFVRDEEVEVDDRGEVENEDQDEDDVFVESSSVDKTNLSSKTNHA